MLVHESFVIGVPINSIMSRNLLAVVYLENDAISNNCKCLQEAVYFVKRKRNETQNLPFSSAIIELRVRDSPLWLCSMKPQVL